MSETFDHSVFSDNRSAVDVFAQSIRRVYRGELGGQRFHALVLAPIQQAGGGVFKYKARILAPEAGSRTPNPHAALPDPCKISWAADPAGVNDAIRLHTTFYSTYNSRGQVPAGGDVVIVALDLGANGTWNLADGEHLGIARKGAYAAAGKTAAECEGLASKFGTDAGDLTLFATAQDAAIWMPIFNGISADGTMKDKVTFKGNPYGPPANSLASYSNLIIAACHASKPSRTDVSIGSNGAGRTVQSTWEAGPGRSKLSLHMLYMAHDLKITTNPASVGLTGVEAVPTYGGKSNKILAKDTQLMQCMLAAEAASGGKYKWGGKLGGRTGQPGDINVTELHHWQYNEDHPEGQALWSAAQKYYYTKMETLEKALLSANIKSFESLRNHNTRLTLYTHLAGIFGAFGVF